MREDVKLKAVNSWFNHKAMIRLCQMVIYFIATVPLAVRVVLKEVLWAGRTPPQKRSVSEDNRMEQPVALACTLWAGAYCLVRAGMGKLIGDFPSLALQAWIGQLLASKPEAQAKEAPQVPRLLVELKNAQLQSLCFG